MSSQDHFVSNIQQFVALDNQCAHLQKQLKELREKRSAVETEVLKYMEGSGMEDTRIKISDGDLRYVVSKSQQSITLAFLKETLDHFFRDNVSLAEQCFEFVKSQRRATTSMSLKRTYNDVK